MSDPASMDVDKKEDAPKDQGQAPAPAPAEPKKILKQKRSPNRLVVDEAVQDDNSVIYLSLNKMEEIGLYWGNTCIIVKTCRNFFKSFTCYPKLKLPLENEEKSEVPKSFDKFRLLYNYYLKDCIEVKLF